jgi:hypothetical protein
MSAWGTGLYSDDTTCDVRDDYVQNLKHGLSSEESSQKILDRYGDLLQKKEIACLVYFALADTAWRYGRLNETIKDRALSLLESGGDVFVWERDAPRSAASRQRVLRGLKKRLGTPQPVEKSVNASTPKPKKIRTTAPIGSVFSLALPSKSFALLVLVGYVQLEESIDPVFSVMDRRFSSPAQLPEQINGSDTTLLFSKSFHRPFRHVAILPKDERRSILSGLEPVNMEVPFDIPYERDSTVWLTVGRIANEVDKHIEHDAA